MTSLARGLAVLRSFSVVSGDVSSAEICQSTGLSRAVVRRCLYTLCEAGYVRRVNSRFQLEPAILSLAQPYYTAKNSLPVVAQPFLEEVNAATNENCSLAVLDGDHIVFLARAVAERIMTVPLTVGSRLPAGYTSLGRVLLSSLPADELDRFLERSPLTNHTGKSVTSDQTFRKSIAETCESGFAIVDEELETGLRSISVPVLDHQGDTYAAMNVGVQAARVDVSELHRTVLPVLKSASKQLSRRLTELEQTPADS
ncbi:helix-turn-helix domain-containing protein [bacterium]|nr:helix-turn-helix domain-containing protein [bacterium]